MFNLYMNDYEELGSSLRFYVRHPFRGRFLREKIKKKSGEIEERILQEIDLASVVGCFEDIEMLQDCLKIFYYKVDSRVKEHIV